MGCPDENTLARRVQGLLSEAEGDALDEHLARCEDCMVVWAALAEVYKSGDGGDEQSPTGEPAIVGRGARIGRYRVERLLGRGAMGVVYAGTDPQLDREVALKLVSPLADVQDDLREQVQSRFVNEARALARLSHPHVVQVLDAGGQGDEVFVAMELVAGRNLAQWKASESPSPARVISVCRQVAQGLAAAHAEGIVHRDVKPDNVLVGDDDRAWITDFGLASLDDQRLSLPTGVFESDEDQTGYRTHDGALVGTPRFMAPEQLLGETADARSDQFGWCAMLYWGLYGKPVYPGETLQELSSNALRGRLRSVPTEPRVPSSVASALRRGLSIDPDDRFESMEALLQAIRPRRSRLGWIFGAGAVAVAAAVVFSNSDATRDCEELAQAQAFEWADADRQRLRDAWRSAGDAPYLDDTWKRVGEALSDYRRDWIGTYAEVCAAKFADDPAAEARFVCLRRRTRAAVAALEVLAIADEDSIRNAARVTASLPSIDECLGDSQQRSGLDPAVEEPLRAELAKAGAFRDAGRYPQALEISESVVARARELGDPVLLVDSLLHLAAAQMELPPSRDAETTYREVASLAEQHHLDVRAARAWVALVFVVGRLQRRVDDAEQAVRQAEAALRRAGDPPGPSRRLLQAKGALAISRGDYDAARRSFETAYAAAERSDDPLAIGRAHNNLGAAAARSGRYEDAVEELTAAISEYERVLGPEHPDIADVLHNLGVMQRELREYDEAEQALRRTLEIRRRALGDKHDKTAASLQALGNVEFARSNYAEAKARLSEALSIVEGLEGFEEERASMFDSLGAIAHRTGDRETARALMRQGLLIRQEQLGDEHPLIVRSQNNLALLLLEDGEVVEALNLLEMARRTLVRAFGEEHADLAPILKNLGGAYARTGRYAEASDALRHLVRVLEKRDGPDADTLIRPLLHIVENELDAKRPDDAEEPLRRAAVLAEGDAEATAKVETLRRRLLAED